MKKATATATAISTIMTTVTPPAMAPAALLSQSALSPPGLSGSYHVGG
jgi:hypothetical protein